MKNNETIVVIGSDTCFNEAGRYLDAMNLVHILPETTDCIDRIISNGPDLILIEGSSSNPDILELLRRIKKENRISSLPMAVISRNDDTDFRKQVYETGIDEFLTCPADEFEFKTRIKSLLRIKYLESGKTVYREAVEEEVTKRTRELTQAVEKVKTANLDTVYRLSRAAEFRDDDVGTHIERMSHYSTAIARALHLDEQYVENILWAAPMHDLGKIGIPDEVLLKPGRLDEQEWVIMRSHTTIGYEILKDSTTDFIKLAGDIALAHHEKWDGSGYPNGLAGEDIPLAGRIVALADVFDALTSERPYKKPFSLEESFSIIREGIGSHFDPEIVQAFFSIQEEIIREFNFWKFMSVELTQDDSESDLSDLF